MTVASIKNQLQYNTDPDRIIHFIAVREDFLSLPIPTPASEIRCPRCNGNLGVYIPSEKAWACTELPCLAWQLGKTEVAAAKNFTMPKKAKLTDYGVPAQYETADPKNFDHDKMVQNAILQVARYAKCFLLFTGGNGIGKTHAAACVMRAFLDFGHRNCRFVTIGEIHDEWKESGFTSPHHKYVDYDLLVLDDIGIYTPTESFLDVIYRIVDKRSGKGTVITTNLSSAMLKERFGGAIFSRMASGMIKPMVGPDKRINKDWT